MRHPVRAAGGRTCHVRAFEAIAIGQAPRASAATIRWLEEHGIITVGRKAIAHDRLLGAITVPDYGVPFDYHRAWCEWAATQPEPDAE